MVRKEKVIDNLFFMIDEDFKQVSENFKFMFGYDEKSGLYRHRLGANISLYPHLPHLPLRKLSAEERAVCIQRYNVSGIICTPEQEDYGIAIPAFQQVENYCYAYNLSAGFGHISGNGEVFHIEPLKGIRLPLDFKDRRKLRKSRVGLERRTD